MAWIPNVNPNELITSAWGNTIRDHVVNTFASAAARDAAIPAPAAGMVCALTDVRALQMYDGTMWVEPGKQTAITIAAQQANISAAVAVTGSNFVLPSRVRRYQVSAMFIIFKGGSAGQVTISPGGTGIPATFTINSGNMTTPESKTISGTWSMSGAGITGGTFFASASAGTVNIEIGSQIMVTDAGSI